MMAAAPGLRPGRAVRIEGLTKKTELNGKKGKLVRQEGERWIGVFIAPCI
jgi:hypothetical protein